MTLTALGLLIFLVAFGILIVFFATRAVGGRTAPLRPIPAFEQLQRLMAQAIEAGRRLHVALGTGRLSDRTAADTLAGLTLLDYVADQSIAGATPPLVTTADPTVMLLAQHQLRQHPGPQTVGPADGSEQVRWISPAPAAYAAGVMTILAREAPVGNIMLGSFGDEYLLMGEVAQQTAVPTIAGTSDPNVLPYIYATSPDGLWGEEIFAAGAYLAQRPMHLGSLFAQDVMRWVIGGIILGGIVLKFLGVFA